MAYDTPSKPSATIAIRASATRSASASTAHYRPDQHKGNHVPCRRAPSKYCSRDKPTTHSTAENQRISPTKSAGECGPAAGLESCQETLAQVPISGGADRSCTHPQRDSLRRKVGRKIAAVERRQVLHEHKHVADNDRQRVAVGEEFCETTRNHPVPTQQLDQPRQSPRAATAASTARATAQSFIAP